MLTDIANISSDVQEIGLLDLLIILKSMLKNSKEFKTGENRRIVSGIQVALSIKSQQIRANNENTFHEK